VLAYAGWGAFAAALGLTVPALLALHVHQRGDRSARSSTLPGILFDDRIR